MTDDGGGNGGRFQVGIVVGAELPRMIAFYTEIMGFEHFRDVPIPGGMVRRYVLGESGLKLMSFDDPPERSNPPGGPTAAGLRYLTVQVPSVPATVERCIAFGCEVPVPPFDYEGSPMAIVADPQGTWIEVIEAVRGS